MMAWAYAKVEHSGVTAAAAAAARDRATELEPQSIATLALSLVKLGCTHAADSRSSVGLKALKRLSRAARF